MFSQAIKNTIIGIVIVAVLSLALTLAISQSVHAAPGVGGPIGPVPIGPIGAWPK